MIALDISVTPWPASSRMRAFGLQDMKKKELQQIIQQLRQDLHTVVMEPLTERAIIISMRVRMEADLEKAIWMGSVNETTKA